MSMAGLPLRLSSGQYTPGEEHRARGWARTAAGLELRLQESRVIMLFDPP